MIKMIMEKILIISIIILFFVVIITIYSYINEIEETSFEDGYQEGYDEATHKCFNTVIISKRNNTIYLSIPQYPKQKNDISEQLMKDIYEIPRLMEYDENTYSCFNQTIDMVRYLRQKGYLAIYIGGWLQLNHKKNKNPAHAWTGVISNGKLIEIESTTRTLVDRNSDYIYEMFETCMITDTGYKIYGCVNMTMLNNQKL